MLSKRRMLDRMNDSLWAHDLTEYDDYADIREEYNEYIHSMEYDDDLLFPNGRDYDAEDEDGPFGESCYYDYEDTY